MRPVKGCGERGQEAKVKGGVGRGTYGVPDHAGGDAHHALVDRVSADGEPPAVAAGHEAEMPLSARLDEVPAHAEKDGGVQDEGEAGGDEFLEVD